MGRRRALRRRRARAVAALAAVGLAAGVPSLAVRPATAAPTDVTSRVSVATAGAQGTGDSRQPSISADGRFVAFASVADNLVPPDAPEPAGDGSQPDSDVFVHDRSTGATSRVSLASDGTERNADSVTPAISADGRQVAFGTAAAFDPTDIDIDPRSDPGRTRFDVYVHDRPSGRTTLVSDPGGGIEVIRATGSSLSRDGRLLAYAATAAPPARALAVAPPVIGPNFQDEPIRVALANGGTLPVTVRSIAFEPASGDFSLTGAADCLTVLLPHAPACTFTVTEADGDNQLPAALVITDDTAQSPHRIPLAGEGPIVNGPAQAPASIDFGPVAPGSGSAVPLTIANPSNQTIVVRGVRLVGATTFTAFPDCSGTTFPVTVPAGGSCTATVAFHPTGPGPASAAAVVDYDFDAFESTEPGTVATALVGQGAVNTVIAVDRDADGNGVLDEPGGTTLDVLTVPGGPVFAQADEPSLSSDGRFLAFSSQAALVGADTNGFRDVYRVPVGTASGVLNLGAPALVSVTPGGAAGAGFSSDPSISADGHAVAFDSSAEDLLAAADENGRTDVFARDLTAGSTVRASVTGAGAEADGGSRDAAVSADGRSVAFVTDAVNLGASGQDDDGDESLDTEIVLRDLVAGSTARISVATGDATPPGTDSREPAVSADGRYVAFTSPFAALVASDSNEADDVFVRDRRPVAQLTPDPMDFGDQVPGRTSGPLPLDIRNAGTGPMLVGALTAAGPDAAAVAVTNPCEGITLFAGESCPTPAEVRVTPSHPGALTATLTLASTAAPASVRVVANGAVSGLVPNPSPVDFGEQPVSTSGPVVPLTLTNTGTVPLRLPALRVEGPMAADFRLVPGSGAAPCPGPEGTLAPAAACTLGLRFRPDAIGIRTAALAIDAVGVVQPNPPTPTTQPTPTTGPTPTEPAPTPTGTPPDQPFTVTVPLTGIGLPGGLTAAPNPADFGGVPLARAGDPVTVTVRVVGPSPIRLGVPVLSGTDTARFSLDATDCAGLTLPAGGSCRLVLRLTPDRVGGPITASVLVPSVDLADPLEVKLIGTGLPGGLAAAPNPARFGAVPVQRQSAPVIVTVRVVGPSPVRLGGLAVAGPDAGRFTLNPGNCAGGTLPPGGSCRLLLQFTPDRVGPATATVLVSSVDTAAPLPIRLDGAGAAPTLVLDPPIGPPGTVVHVTGTGYPPGSTVELSWDPGLGGEQARVDGAGAIDDYLLVFRRDGLGGRQAVATGVAGVHVEQPFLVVPPGAAPPKFINDR